MFWNSDALGFTYVPLTLTFYSLVERSDSAGHSTESFVNQINVPFDCKVEPSFVGYVFHNWAYNNLYLYIFLGIH